jgi:hypothetical protein
LIGLDSPYAQMSFGFSAGDFLAATKLNGKIINEIRESREFDVIIVLSFRALQAQRINEMQGLLLQLSREKIALKEDLLNRHDEEPRISSSLEVLNNNIDKYSKASCERLWMVKYSTTLIP